jgi:hypothetical protein
LRAEAMKNALILFAGGVFTVAGLLAYIWWGLAQ